MDKLSFLVLGAGAIGQRHAANIIQLGHACEIIGFRKLVDLDSILRLGYFDGVIIATASQVRTEVLTPCFQSLIPVYIEKPIAFDIEIVEQIYSLPESYLKKCYAGYMMRFHPIISFLLGLDYSEAYNFSFEIGYDVNRWRKNWEFSGSYASQSDGGGVLLDLCHEIDLANILFSPLTLREVLCLDHKNFESVDFASLVTFTNTHNLIGTVSMDYLSPINRRKLIVKGAEYIDEIDFLTGVYSRLTAEGVVVKKFPFERNQMFIDAIDHFSKSILGEAQVSLDLPSLNCVKSSCELTANAWKSRTFVGSIKGEMS